MTTTSNGISHEEILSFGSVAWQGSIVFYFGSVDWQGIIVISFGFVA
jgi:hypothetical protein